MGRFLWHMFLFSGDPFHRREVHLASTFCEAAQMENSIVCIGFF
jgi:hypothetical protein